MIDVPNMYPVLFPVINKEELQEGGYDGQVVQLDKHASLHFGIKADFRYQKNQGVDNYYNVGHGYNQAVHQRKVKKTLLTNAV